MGNLVKQKLGCEGKEEKYETFLYPNPEILKLIRYLET